MHQVRMRLFQSFWGWTKNTSSSPTQGFFNTLLCPKFFPSYLPRPSYLPHLISRSHHLQNSKELPSMNSIELWGDVRHKAWGRWIAQHWTNVQRKFGFSGLISSLSLKGHLHYILVISKWPYMWALHLRLGLHLRLLKSHMGDIKMNLNMGIGLSARYLYNFAILAHILIFTN